MFHYANRIADPEVLIPYESMGIEQYHHRTLHGDFRRVFLTTAKEWAALRMLVPHEDTFAPVKGDGIIVRESAIRQFA